MLRPQQNNWITKTVPVEKIMDEICSESLDTCQLQWALVNNNYNPMYVILLFSWFVYIASATMFIILERILKSIPLGISFSNA